MTENPYAAPGPHREVPSKASVFPPKDKGKIDAIVKDAGQFWLALLMCILCGPIGALIIPIWYFVRLLQWIKLSKKYPALLNPHTVQGSLGQKFRAAQWRLMVGMVFGGVIWSSLLVYLVVT